MFNYISRKSIKQILAVGGAQATIQGVGFISGLIIIRGLSPSEYSLYTIAFATLGTLGVISDSGLSAAVMAECGKSDGAPHSLGKILNEAKRLRKEISIACACIVMPAMFWLLITNETGYANAIAISMAVISIYYSTLTGQLYEVILKLSKRIYLLQRIQITGAILRLITIPIILIVFPKTWVVILTAGVIQIGISLMLKKKCQDVAAPINTRDENTRNALLKIVQRAMPSAIYYSLSGQIATWAISIFGDLNAIAQVGVSGRLAMSLSLISSVLYTVGLPRFAQKKATPDEILKNYISIIIIMGFITLLCWVMLYALKGHLDLVLGNKYAHMEYEVLLGFYATSLILIGGVSHWFAASRGIIAPPWLYISVSLLFQIAALFCFDLTSARGVLTMASFLAPIQPLINISYTWYRLKISNNLSEK